LAVIEQGHITEKLGDFGIAPVLRRIGKNAGRNPMLEDKISLRPDVRTVHNNSAVAKNKNAVLIQFNIANEAFQGVNTSYLVGKFI
jgi:hypothetical protein